MITKTAVSTSAIFVAAPLVAGVTLLTLRCQRLFSSLPSCHAASDYAATVNTTDDGEEEYRDERDSQETYARQTCRWRRRAR